MSISVQEDLFRAADGALPEGFRYSAEIVRPDLQRRVLEAMPTLAFKAFDFHGFEGKRRTVSFGWKYDFDSQRVRRADAMPSVLLPIREVVARFAGVEPDALVQALVTEYGPGAPIGWHKDKFVFGRVVGVSLLSSCTFRLRRRDGAKWQRRSLVLEPGSAYLMTGASRTLWEHSIPPVDRLRYSITFRELAE
ncbi:alpha-ketoglutarate-dependent dioxygenase AlkB [Rhizobium ruizarguesonis]|uniref:alpha-ketoglutarate-dependent dioxygenase AlkB n=1 Tax=Rhizobium ruizarguesonis TaxID=2081791 RepID=UPI00103242DE|nr:alpha-ketoglutarate-dependent dioxygenase AlkB [Rhizobium ruizarguesonis]TBA50983.1 alpha-ketoglutarate-dependent dioxygenase AlkB [Rhizobium ruizarguesonis]TBA95574.1 alpha-ketoglutarate-dependent dioxygenase AlkB [Rhizobium ruizarguesonis]TBB36636.1 alpha-ketoglutarate-dependent dioxygenase AlkB [Rhizobium ruizarguesonis]TBC01513.1 alpha-ketoglutarate-dependent dioxygenase AlkB [Rhizobium ruizarguesonis]TBC06460.1 alpha-ketoglutarate-dependent dioxygenase AlkB [Rhizobium ruizarguesonis]